MIKYKSSKLLEELNKEKGFNTIKKSVTPEKYLCRILRHKKSCAENIKNIVLNRRLQS